MRTMIAAVAFTIAACGARAAPDGRILYVAAWDDPAGHHVATIDRVIRAPACVASSDGVRIRYDLRACGSDPASCIEIAGTESSVSFAGAAADLVRYELARPGSYVVHFLTAPSAERAYHAAAAIDGADGSGMGELYLECAP